MHDMRFSCVTTRFTPTYVRQTLLRSFSLRDTQVVHLRPKTTFRGSLSFFNILPIRRPRFTLMTPSTSLRFYEILLFEMFCSWKRDSDSSLKVFIFRTLNITSGTEQQPRLTHNHLTTIQHGICMRYFTTFYDFGPWFFRDSFRDSLILILTHILLLILTKWVIEILNLNLYFGQVFAKVRWAWNRVETLDCTSFET